MLSAVDRTVAEGARYGRELWRTLIKTPSWRAVQALERQRYAQLWQKQLRAEEANAAILRMLLERQPLFVGRIGHTEGRIVGESLFRDGRFGRLTRKQAHQNAGIFPVTPDVLSRFATIYADSIAQADLLGFWQTSFQARLLAEHYSGIPLAPLPALEPYLHESPWSAGLEGRRVLVVHPFAASVTEQYGLKRTRLFANPAILPEFELQVLAPPQTLAPMTEGYATWLEALDRLTERVLQLQFDVALLGCGAYGLPVGAAIKASGRQAIQLGGALQVLFGIRGRRWEQMPTVASLMNDHWIRPSLAETPSCAARVDQGCYW